MADEGRKGSWRNRDREGQGNPQDTQAGTLARIGVESPVSNRQEG